MGRIRLAAPETPRRVKSLPIRIRLAVYVATWDAKGKETPNPCGAAFHCSQGEKIAKRHRKKRNVFRCCRGGEVAQRHRRPEPRAETEVSQTTKYWKFTTDAILYTIAFLRILNTFNKLLKPD